MFQTGYKGISNIAKTANHFGGICKWWFVPVQHIAIWPSVVAQTQALLHKPTLYDGKQWQGPVAAAKGKLSFDEKPKRTAAGIYYEQRVIGITPGDDRINFQNLPYHRYIILAQPRTGFYWLVIGTPQSPLFFDADYSTGNHWRETAEADISFKTECRHKAQLVPFTEEEIGGTITLPQTGLRTEGGAALVTEDGLELII